VLRRLRDLFKGGHDDGGGDHEPFVILAVDDDEHIRELLTLTFESRGYKVMTARNGAEGLHKAAEYRPDLIVMDANMPVLGGFEAVKKLKQDRRTTDIPVIMLTSRWQQGDVVAGFRYGVLDYVTKPFIPEEMVKSVETILAKR
jgi:DNA-binding response OmpR family regulator